MYIRLKLSVIFLSLWISSAIAQEATKWADSVLNSLSNDERIAQLIMVRLSGIDLKTRVVSFYDTTVERDIKKYNIGGICLFQGAPVKQANLVNRFQSIAKTPILMAIDAENGVGMRFDSVPGLPRMMMLGAVRDSRLVYQYGKWVAEQCRQMGIQVNFAPVVDVNNNPNNPVINDRSFGENKEKVANWGIQYMLGMKEAGILGSAKHFPGHGDVDVDSHLALPLISKSRKQLDNLELYPFRKLMDAGIGSVMVGHLFIPDIDSTPNRASSISPKIVTDLLRNEMGYSGLIFTDGLEMKGVDAVYPNGAAGVESLVAGNDMLCLPGEVGTVIAKVKEAIEAGRISWEQINQHARRVLVAKYEAGLNQRRLVAIDGLTERLNAQTPSLKREIAEKAITLVKFNHDGHLPLMKGKERIAVLDIAQNRNSAFALAMRRNYNADVFSIDQTKSSTYADSLLSILQANYDLVVTALHELPRFPANNFNMSATSVKLLNTLAASKPSIQFIFGNPYVAKNFCDAGNLFVCYDDDPITQEVAVDMLMGKLNPEGQLPVSVCTNMPAGTGFSFTALPLTMLQPAQSAVFPAEKIARIDSIIQDAISRKAAPGMVLLAMKDGRVILEKAYGKLSYNGKEKTSQDAVYDMASVTKICATTLSVMKLYDEKKLELDKTLGDYIPWVRGTNKENIIIRDVLLHEAGLKAFIPFYKEIADSLSYKPFPGYFSKVQDKTYGIKVDDSLFMRTAWRDTMINRILTSSVDARKPYIYSDNDFIFMGELIREITGQSLDEYAWNSFYRPLGFMHTGFNPTRYIDKKGIAPTEQDPYFRERLVRGFVHDPGAAMFGGVSGHAGLFSNAYEIAVLMQMVLDGGVLNGKRFISDSTIKRFTAYQSQISRRGLGFDKPEKDNTTRKVAYPAAAVSQKTFGHTGFTGTCTWADPESKTVFVLLANRVHPTAKNTFLDLNVRGKVMEEIFGK